MMYETVNNEDKSTTREPILAAVLAFLCLGLGHGYNGQRKKGYLFFSSYFLFIIIYILALKFFNEPLTAGKENTSLTSPSYLTALIFLFCVWIYSIYDAYQSAKRINRGGIVVYSTPGKSALIYLATTIIGGGIALFIFILLSIFLLPFLGIKVEGKAGSQNFTCPRALKRTLGQAATNQTTDDQPQSNGSQFIINGISYSKTNPMVIINKQAYGINDKIGTGTIIDITPEKIVVKYNFGEREYRTGSSISY